MSFSKLSQPKQNPFRLFILSINDRSVYLKKFSSDKIISSKLSNLKGEGTYCNSYNDLFISEGNNFWIINHDSFQIRYKKMPILKKNHSMIFTPALFPQSTEGRIFIVGGDDKKSFYYDLKKNYFIKWAETNEIHKNPALIQIGDYLYIFDSLNQNSFCFERTKLTEINKKWEKIIPNYDPNIIVNFPSQTFATSLDSDGNVVFIGGDNIDMNHNNSFIYSVNENKIYLSKKGTNDSMNFNDKTFYKIDNKYCMALPDGLEEIKEIALVDKNEQSLIKTNININLNDNYPLNICLNCKGGVGQNYINNYSNMDIQNNQKNTKLYNITNQTKKIKPIEIKDQPKEFGYYISSYSSEESKIKARNDKIEILEIRKNNIPIKIVEKTDEQNVQIQESQKAINKDIKIENEINEKIEIEQN